jgi:predicted MFS family arabinose efflux permease
VLAAFLAFGMLWGAWAALLPSTQRATGLSNGELGVALLFVGLGSLPAMTSAGLLIDRYGAVVLPVSLAALAGAAVLPSLAGSLVALSAALLVLGAASGAADVAINAEVAALEAATQRTFMPLAHALFSAGVIVGAVGSGAARQLGAGRVAVLGTTAVVIGAVAWANRHPYPRLAESAPRRTQIRRALVFLGAICALAFCIEGGIENWSALFLERELDAPPAVSALGPGAYAVAMVAGRLSAQWLNRSVGNALLLGAGGCISVVGLLVASVAETAAVAIPAFFVAGIGVSFAAPLLFGAAGRGAPDAERGAAVATVTTLGYLGFLAGPPIVGAVAQGLGIRASFVLLAGAAAIVAAAAPRLQLLR